MERPVSSKTNTSTGVDWVLKPTSRRISHRSSERNARDRVPANWQIGTVILDRYEVTRQLGEGGMGTVYHVLDYTYGIELAVKSPRPEIFSRASGKENFIHEARTWINLADHPHIVTCFFVETLGGTPRIFAEYVDGGSLASWIRDRRLYQGGKQQALERILDIAIQFAWGLNAAHEQGIVHQDIKPANVMMTSDGTAKVTDFGLAKAHMVAGSSDHQKASDPLVSWAGMTPAYCSPEQAKRLELSRKTDIWSWGVSLLHLFVGQVTWMSGAVAPEVLAAYERRDKAYPLMPAEIVQLLERCFQQEPADRPATMQEIAIELEEIYTRLLGRPYPRQKPASASLDEDALFRRAYSLLELGRLAEALALAKQVIQLNPNLILAYQLQANGLKALGRTQEALAVLEQASRLSPNDAVVYQNLGLTLRDLARFDEALAALEQAIHLHPSDVLAYRVKADVLLVSFERYDEALEVYEQVLHLNPSDAGAYQNKGKALLHLRIFDQALSAFEQALRLDPDDEIIYVGQGVALHYLGRYSEALQAYDRAIQLDLTYLEAYQNKGLILGSLGRFKEALEMFEHVIQLDLTYLEAYQKKAQALHTLGRSTEALMVLDQAIRLFPNAIETFIYKGVVLQELGKTKEALASYEQAIRLDPHDALAIYEKGVLLEHLENYPEALASYEQATRVNPTFADAWMNKGVMYARLRQFAEALSAFDQVIRLNPSWVLAYWNQARALCFLGRFPEALAAFDQVIRLDPDHLMAYQNKAIVLRQLGRIKEAEQTLLKVRELALRSRR